MGEKTLKIHSPQTCLHTNTNKNDTLFFILCITTEGGRLSIFSLKVLRDEKKRDSLFVLHDSSCFSRTRRFR